MLRVGVIILLLAGCASVPVAFQFFGLSQPRDRVVSALPEGHIDFWEDVKPVFDQRCVVCHGCYDAPCQLKLSSIEGIERGGSKEDVYNTSRFTPAQPTRLFEDATSVEQWREKGFYPALNEYEQTSFVNKQAGLIYQVLLLKEHNPLVSGLPMPTTMPSGSSRKHSCPTVEEFPNFAKKNPQWGMPYGLPALSAEEGSAVKKWLVQGALYTPRDGHQSQHFDTEDIVLWEQTLNQDGVKNRLIARYIYEHLFLAHIYFDTPRTADEYRYYSLVRSSTPPGEPVKRIATRRPFDHPKVDRVYYRFVPQLETISAKNHIPYALNEQRMENWNKWFYAADFEVSELPGYESTQASNPFLTFAQLPLKSRYHFLLDEAQFTIMNFIKGPVCRGQVAVNVIRDHFWVFFANPDFSNGEYSDKFLAENYEYLQLPNSQSGVYSPLSTWRRYAKKQQDFLAIKEEYFLGRADEFKGKGESLIWGGNKENKNAALTIFRHFDNASVEQGLLGQEPETIWVIDYPLLEQIYYLLVASYDVYGNFGHQVISRIYMDFLRMDGESTFLYLLPEEERSTLRSAWYQGEESHASKYMKLSRWDTDGVDVFEYEGESSKAILVERLKARVAAPYRVPDSAIGMPDDKLLALDGFVSAGLQHMPEVSIVEITNDKTSSFYTIFKNTAHKNVATMFNEGSQIIPENTSLTVLAGIWGAYPNAFYSLKSSNTAQFSQHIRELETQSDFLMLRNQYGMLRMATDFWAFSDRLHEASKQQDPIAYGVLDYNRLVGY